MTGAQSTQRAFAVVSIMPSRDPMSPGTIEGLCERIQGVGALHVDADRGKIHVLYDGNVSVIAEIEQGLRMLGHSVRHPGQAPRSSRHTHEMKSHPETALHAKG